MLKLYSLNVIDPNAPLEQSVALFRERFQWFDRIPCWMRGKRHCDCSAVWFTGTANAGLGWRMCRRCGRKKLYARIAAKYSR